MKASIKCYPLAEVDYIQIKFNGQTFSEETSAFFIQNKEPEYYTIGYDAKQIITIYHPHSYLMPEIESIPYKEFDYFVIGNGAPEINTPEQFYKKYSPINEEFSVDNLITIYNKIDTIEKTTNEVVTEFSNQVFNYFCENPMLIPNYKNILLENDKLKSEKTLHEIYKDRIDELAKKLMDVYFNCGGKAGWFEHEMEGALEMFFYKKEKYELESEDDDETENTEDKLESVYK